MDGRRKDARALREDIERELARAVDPANILPLLHRLVRIADENSDDAFFAQLHLAELLVERNPWRSALHARRVVGLRPSDDRGWATLGLCHALLGNYRSAVACYRRALEKATSNPWYAHNLGHLLDVALNRPDEAASTLAQAHQGAPESADIAASYAHALARAGNVAQGRMVLERALKRKRSEELVALLGWMDEGVHSDGDQSASGPASVHTTLGTGGFARVIIRHTRTRAHHADGGPTSGVDPGLEAILTRGLERLPLDAGQRERARWLARDTPSQLARPSGSRSRTWCRSTAPALAAAVAYAIVFVDRVPLSQAEVASCFRVSVANLRARFGELRAHLDLMPGDTRYRTGRRR